MKDFTWYVAGPWDHKAEVYELVKKVNAAGWQTCSRWAEPDNTDIDPNAPDYEEQRRFQATRDVEDVTGADGLIYVNSKLSEGKATELGMSMALIRPIIIIGDRRTNIFLSLDMPCFPTIEEALVWLEGDGRYYINWVTACQEDHFRRLGRLYGSEDEDEDPMALKVGAFVSE